MRGSAWRWRSPAEDIRQGDASVWAWAFEPTPLMVGDEGLFLAHLGNGTGNGLSIDSQVVLINLDTGRAAQVRARLTNGGGLPIPGVFEGESAAGQLELNIPPGGMAVVSSSGQGDLQTGALRFESDQPLAGSILFSPALPS